MEVRGQYLNARATARGTATNAKTIKPIPVSMPRRNANTTLETTNATATKLSRPPEGMNTSRTTNAHPSNSNRMAQIIGSKSAFIGRMPGLEPVSKRAVGAKASGNLNRAGF